MGANSSHIPLHRSSRTTTPRTTAPSTPATTFTSPTISAPSTAHGSPATTYTTPSPTYYTSAPNERTSISCEPARSPRDENVPLRIGYPYYEEVVALEARQRGSRRRSRAKSLGKVLDTIGFSSSGGDRH